MVYKELYKARRTLKLADSLAKRCQDVAADRQEKQREFFWSKRAIAENSIKAKPDTLETKKKTRVEMFQKWKAEKQRKLEEDKKRKKPVFKVGVIQRTATGSPLILDSIHNRKKKILPVDLTQSRCQQISAEDNAPGVMTRSRAKACGKALQVVGNTRNPVKKHDGQLKNQFCKIDRGTVKSLQSYKFKVPKSVSVLPFSNTLTFPNSPKITKKNTGTLKTRESTVETNVDTASPTSKNINIKETKLETKSQNDVESEQMPENSPIMVTSCLTTPDKKSETDDYRPIHYSPFVTVRSNKKLGKQKKGSLSLSINEQIKKEENEFHCRIFSFRKYIECETKRLLELCEKWRNICNECEEIPADIVGEIDSIIGKTKLLTSDKFMQFKGLIDKCESGDPLIKLDDLQGFQDWVSIEVERLDEGFCKLDTQKCNNWIAEETKVLQKEIQKPKLNNPTVKKPVGRSNIRSHIMAARKMLKEENKNVSPTSIPFNTPTVKKSENLRKEVLNSATKRRNSSFKSSPRFVERRNSGLEIMIASQKNKFSTPVKAVYSENLVSSANLDKTPSKSILKKTPAASNTSKNMVTFKQESDKVGRRSKALSEKYLRPLIDDGDSPLRLVLGDLNLNTTPSTIKTRSKTRQELF